MHRTESLAVVALTRRKDVIPLRFDVQELDFIFRIKPRDGEVDEFRIFGVSVKGTEEPLSSNSKATVVANAMFRGRKKGVYYFFPVISLLFSMDDDKGFIGWMMQPGIDEVKEEPKLWMKDKILCRLFSDEVYDEMIGLIESWYDLLDTKIITGHEVDKPSASPRYKSS